MKSRLVPDPLCAASVAPEEAARAMRSSPGFVFLESSLAVANSVSLLACEPDLLIEGGPSEWGRLESELAARQRPGADLGFPDGAAIGWVGFDGRFRFGFYENLAIFLHGPSIWHNARELPGLVDGPEFPKISFRARLKRAQFENMVRAAHEYIAAGDIYQVCLSHSFEAEFAADAWPFYESLRHHSPAPCAAFLDLGGTQVASASPECFLRISGRRVVTRPIKGTRPRRADPQRDQRSAYDLITSAKEIAELVMITDLERNDLGRVCDYGSVTVPELLKLESYEQVHHLVSTITGTLRPDVTHPAALRACFPGGSISGAPKKRALEVISELEPHPRGIYTGAIGYFGYNGESQFSIAIRTAVFESDSVSFHVGAGIVADSIPEREWQETLDKAAGLVLSAGLPPHVE
ncbi:MAG TPA: aminodeoxychorismate synthase component I [Terrimicrobiaceae bacterium]